MSSISDFTIDRFGAAAPIPEVEVWRALGMLQTDQWEDKRRQDQKIDGVLVTIQRRGWRLVVWGREDTEPSEVDAPALPPPPGYDPEAASAPMRIVPVRGKVLEQPEQPKRRFPWAVVALAPLPAFALGWWLHSGVLMALTYVLLVALAVLLAHRASQKP